MLHLGSFLCQFCSAIMSYICKLYHGCEGVSLITVPIHEGEARVKGQLAYDNPDVAMV